jgi:MoCo/4Fe-4S cofactor protein with predicted Tat translocation signal
MKVQQTDWQLTREQVLQGQRPGQRTTVLNPRQDDGAAEQQEIVFKQEAGRRLDLADVRQRLADKQGPAYWQSLEELSEDPAFTELMQREFPRLAPEATTVNRRGFLKLMGASMAMAGLTACTRQPKELIVPYVRAPEEFVPSKATYFATNAVLDGYALGLLAESHMGRPTKLEGNPEHPASLGSADALAQAALLGLYDPDRSQQMTFQGQPVIWMAFQQALLQAMLAEKERNGAGLRIVTGSLTSPSQVALIRRVLADYPEARWIQYDAVGADAARAGARMAFGEVVDTVYDFGRADVVVALDADFMGEGPARMRYARDFMQRRRLVDGADNMNRLYAFESVPSVTGAAADHALPMRSHEVEAFTRALARAFGIDAAGPALNPEQQRWLDAVVDDLNAHRGAAALVVGERQPAAVHAMVHAIHEALGCVGATVTRIAPVVAEPQDQQAALQQLAADLDAGQVQTLLLLDNNLAYTAPGDLALAEKLAQVPFTAHLGLYQDETAARCQWHVPMAHDLEGWGDARAFDGTLGVVQPLIEPLYAGRTAQQVLATALGETDPVAYDLVKQHWLETGLAGDASEQAWRRALHDGLVADSAFPAKSVSAAKHYPPQADVPAGLELLFVADSGAWDGRYANNGWLQEMPRSMTKLTWDNAVQVSPLTAEELGVVNGDVVELTYQGRTVQGPVWIVPGHAAGAVSLPLGFGRTAAGVVGDGVGFSAYPLRSHAAPWRDAGVQVRVTGERMKLATTQSHHRMEGIKDRHIVRVATLEQFLKKPGFAHYGVYNPAEDETMYPPYDYSQGYQWAMTIDLNTCTGCNACLVACQAENNIPVVGKDEVANGREMHWIRVDRYYTGELDAPQTHVQPVTCMHCENAPCEPVCPVAATVHSAEGLNQMVYNRCIGTRYCSNNCPYKVRRFNFYQYADETTPQLKMLRNPNVTVRVRGVMEKCTYCVQRISKARIYAERDRRTIADGEVTTACQQACPTQAIYFGNLNDPDSAVNRAKASPLNYSLLGELNVRPRTTYLAKVKNVNPALQEGDAV